MKKQTQIAKWLSAGFMASSLVWATQASAGSAQNGVDGAMPFPKDYLNWDTFLSNIEKKSGHIRDIYINDIGAKAKQGEPFANGTVSVMEIYQASGEAGSMKKGALQKVFVMYKGTGYGANAPQGLQNGDWVYSAFDAKGNRLKANYNSCRSCHAPLTTKDYIFHYDKYFQNRLK